MKFLIAPDSFKNSLSADLVCEAIKTGLKKNFPNSKMEKIPLADGGEGTVDCIISAIGGNIQNEFVLNPLLKKVKATYGILQDGKTAIVEMATASGIEMVPPNLRNPLNTTTYGTGELLRKIIEKGFKNIVLGTGGSATTDCGAGALQALGVKLLDKYGKSIPINGAGLNHLEKIELDDIKQKYKDVKLQILYDVKNTLLGNDGAVIYSPQKGASKDDVKQIKKNLKNFAKIVHKQFSITPFIGSGAGGGLVFGLSILFNAELVSGSQYMIKLNKLEEKIENFDIIITGEGELNSQTANGKIPFEVARLAKEKNKKVIGIFGKDNSQGKFVALFDQIISLTDEHISTEESMENAYKIIVEKMNFVK